MKESAKYVVLGTELFVSRGMIERFEGWGRYVK